MGFEVFKKGQRRSARGLIPFITVGTHPRINFSRACVKWMAEHDINTVDLLHDRELSLIAFQRAETGYSVTLRQSQGYVSASMFLRHIGAKPGRYVATFDDENKRIVVALGCKDEVSE